MPIAAPARLSRPPTRTSGHAVTTSDGPPSEASGDTAPASGETAPASGGAEASGAPAPLEAPHAAATRPPSSRSQRTRPAYTPASAGSLHVDVQVHPRVDAALEVVRALREVGDVQRAPLGDARP